MWAFPSLALGVLPLVGLLALTWVGDVHAQDAPPPSPGFLALADPAFARYPARTYRGAPRRPVFSGANARYREYRTRIAEDSAQGANFAGDHALVSVGCGSGCATAFDVGLRDGRVRLLPTGWYANDVDLMHRPDSRYLKVLYRATRAGEDRCIGQAYVWTGARLAPVGRELSAPVGDALCDGFERPPRE